MGILAGTARYSSYLTAKALRVLRQMFRFVDDHASIRPCFPICQEILNIARARMVRLD